MSKTLKPCPFCGATSAEMANCIELEDCANFEVCDDCEYVTVLCPFTNGGCGATGGYRKTPEEAIEAWNRRSQPQLKRLTIEQLRKMHGEPIWISELEKWAVVAIDIAGTWAGKPFAKGNYFEYDIEKRGLTCYADKPQASGENDEVLR